MKLNWGTGIAIFYGLFMIVMITFVVKARNVDHSLVVDNYYEEDIAYQQHLDKVANSKSLDVDLTIAKGDDESVDFTFPDLGHSISGEAWFYRPNDNSKDFTIEVRPDNNGHFGVNTGHLVSGLWRVKVEWEAGGVKYYKEQELYL